MKKILLILCLAMPLWAQCLEKTCSDTLSKPTKQCGENGCTNCLWKESDLPCCDKKSQSQLQCRYCEEKIE